jgi:hypothetical protein
VKTGERNATQPAPLSNLQPPRKLLPLNLLFECDKSMASAQDGLETLANGKEP